MSKESIATIKSEIDAICSREDFIKDAVGLLVRLCEIDTTPNHDVGVMERNEKKIFQEIRSALKGIEGRETFHAISPAIEKHPAFTPLHFTKTSSRPEGLDFATVYRNRGNMLFTIDAANDAPGSNDGRSIALNAHVDVVAPYFPPREENGFVHGRGTCDDKGAVVEMIMAARALSILKDKLGIKLNRRITLMFVVEEETGGNGSLSLAIDRDLRKLYDSILVLECTDNDLYPANRGAVWYRTELATSVLPNICAASYAILEMEEEGAKIKGESAHPLFPQRPVQTCHGIIGGFGEHPSRICGHVALKIKTDASNESLKLLIARALDKYISRYGDKTKAVNPETGLPKVEKHYSLELQGSDSFKLDIFGSTGHMGAILENDCAITKMAYIVREIIEDLPADQVREIILEREKSPFGKLVLEGGQGFIPTHRIEDVMKRMSDAAERGMKRFQDKFGTDLKASCRTSFDKLHNAAFDGDPRSPSMLNAIRAMEICGLREASRPVVGWTVSCDARLFACEYPDLPVITSGAGKLKNAHSDNENINIKELMDSVRFLLMYLLMETGTV